MCLGRKAVRKECGHEMLCVECGYEMKQFRRICFLALKRLDKTRGLKPEEPCRLWQGTQQVVRLC